MKKITKLLIPTDASEHFCKTLYLPKGHPIFGVYENAIESLIESLEEDEDDELSTIESQLEFISQHMSHEIVGNYENDLSFAESIMDMEIIAPDENSKAA